MPERQSQRGGETQVQAGRDVVVNVGLDVAAVREIYELQAATLRQELTAHAEDLVSERLGDLEQRMVSRFNSPELLPAFADPDFQFNILEAQRAAARSGEADDLDLIVDVLTQRAVTPPTPRLKLATRRALDVVGQIDAASLRGLTAFWYGMRMLPLVGTLDALLDRINAALSPFVLGGLPEGDAWQTDALMLDCLHSSPGAIGGIKEYWLYFAESEGPGFTCAGMDADTAAMVRDGFSAMAPQLGGLVVVHPLDPDRFCLIGRSEDHFRATGKLLGQLQGCDPIDLENAFEFAVSLNGYGERLGNLVEALQPHVRSRLQLVEYADWWGKQQPYNITAVGTVVAYANYCRINPEEKLPALVTLI